MAGQGAKNVSVADLQLSIKIHGKFNNVLKEVLVVLIKPHAESQGKWTYKEIKIQVSL